MNPSMESEYLYTGERVEGMDFKPESMPCFLTTAFVMDDLTEVGKVYAKKGYTYIRTNNPNRTALAETVTMLEGGAATDIFASGMGAITSTLLTLVEKGDHILCNSAIYGETYNVLEEIMPKCSVETSYAPLHDLAAAKAAIRPNTKIIYTEVVSNPTIRIADIEGLAKMAHEAGALLIVDNTFTSPFAIRPLDHGADMVINSLTKFLNGHSDAMGGSLTIKDASLMPKIHHMAMLCGTPGDPFSAWLIERGLRTAALRIPRQIETAAKLAHALEKNPHVELVNHTSLDSHPQRELAKKLLGEDGGSAMLSFIVPEDIKKIDVFMGKLRYARYAPTLGGFRTTMSHPVTSSHPNVPDDVRRAMGITPGMIRISVGIEKAEDLIADFEQALTAFDE